MLYNLFMKIVTIHHPKGSLFPVTVRNGPRITDSYYSAIYTNDWFEADFEDTGSGNLSVQINHFEGRPEFEGKYVFIRYGGKTFADVREKGTPIPPAKKIIGWIKPDWIRRRFEFGNIPDLEPFFPASAKNNGRIPYTPRIQQFLYDNLKVVNPDYFSPETNEPNELTPEGNQGIKDFNKDFVYLLDDELFLCNDHGSETGPVYPVGRNLKSKEKILGNAVAAGGQFIELWDDKPYPLQRKGSYYLMKTINANSPNLEDFGYLAHPERWHRPSIRFGAKGQLIKRTEPFSVFHPAGAIFALLTNNTDVAFIASSAVEVIDLNKPLPAQFTNDWSTYPWISPLDW